MVTGRACDDVQSDEGQVADSSHVEECTTSTQQIVGLYGVGRPAQQEAMWLRLATVAGLLPSGFFITDAGAICCGAAWPTCLFHDYVLVATVRRNYYQLSLGLPISNLLRSHALAWRGRTRANAERVPPTEVVRRDEPLDETHHASNGAASNSIHQPLITSHQGVDGWLKRGGGKILSAGGKDGMSRSKSGLQ